MYKVHKTSFLRSIKLGIYKKKIPAKKAQDQNHPSKIALVAKTIFSLLYNQAVKIKFQYNTTGF